MSETIKPLSSRIPSKETEIAPKRRPLTFQEGFVFGLGFWIAGFLFLTVGVPILTVLAFLVFISLGSILGGR